jgi:hypothetical protein
VWVAIRLLIAADRRSGVVLADPMSAESCVTPPGVASRHSPRSADTAKLRFGSETSCGQSRARAVMVPG